MFKKKCMAEMLWNVLPCLPCAQKHSGIINLKISEELHFLKLIFKEIWIDSYLYTCKIC